MSTARAASAAALALLVLLAPWATGAALAKRPAKAQEAEQPQGEPIEISGRVAVGLDKIFIKDAEGFLLVQGLDLAPFAGRNITAKALLLRRDQDYRIVRLLEYRLASPDDESPGAGGAVRQGAAREPGRRRK